MDTFNLKDVTTQALRQLERSEASAKAVKEYRTTGFGSVIRYFTRQDIFDVNIDMPDASRQDRTAESAITEASIRLYL